MDNINKDVKIHFINRTNIDECIIDIHSKIKLQTNKSLILPNWNVKK